MLITITRTTRLTWSTTLTRQIRQRLSHRKRSFKWSWVVVDHTAIVAMASPQRVIFWPNISITRIRFIIRRTRVRGWRPMTARWAMTWPSRQSTSKSLRLIRLRSSAAALAKVSRWSTHKSKGISSRRKAPPSMSRATSWSTWKSNPCPRRWDIRTAPRLWQLETTWRRHGTTCLLFQLSILIALLWLTRPTGKQQLIKIWRESRNWGSMP